MKSKNFPNGTKIRLDFPVDRIVVGKCDVWANFQEWRINQLKKSKNLLPSEQVISLEKGVIDAPFPLFFWAVSIPSGGPCIVKEESGTLFIS